MTKADPSLEPTAIRYFEYAREVNEVARLALRLDTRDATALQAKISIGLSLQSAELATKGILRVLGVRADEIRKAHRDHNVLQMLRDVDDRIQKHENRALRLYGGFMRWTPIIDGAEFRVTVSEYMEKHFSTGRAASPRNYLYPDLPNFTGPNPIQAIYVIVEHIIACGLLLLEAQSPQVQE